MDQGHPSLHLGLAVYDLLLGEALALLNRWGVTCLV